MLSAPFPQFLMNKIRYNRILQNATHKGVGAVRTQNALQTTMQKEFSCFYLSKPCGVSSCHFCDLREVRHLIALINLQLSLSCPNSDVIPSIPVECSCIWSWFSLL
jgi:hypothetical protein